MSKFSVRKPFTVLVGVILITVLGVMSIINTSTDLLPAMDLPFTAVFTTYPGATPEQVERDVTIPLEARMSTLSGIENLQSISMEHVSVVILQFTGAVNMDSASLEIREALDMMTLPDGASRPMTIRMNPEMLPVMSASVFMEGAAIDELSEFARYVIAPAIEGVPGVAVVSLSGLVQNQLNIIIREELISAVNQSIGLAVQGMMAEMAQHAEAAITERVEEFSRARIFELVETGLSMGRAVTQMQQELPEIIESITLEVMGELATARGQDPLDMGLDLGMGEGFDMGIPAEMLSVDTIIGMLMAQDFAMPAGMITDDDAQFVVRVGDRFDDLDEIKNMLLFDPAQMGLPGVPPVLLSDIADVFVTDDSHLTFTRVNGNPSIMLSIQRQGEFPTADVTGAVRERMDLLSAEHQGLGFAVLMDQGEMIGIIISSVLDNLLYGGILSIIILLLFLRDIRPTLIVAVSIPVSLMFAFTLMYFTGVSINMISMGGLALAVGMLIDNSIIVIENIYRMRTAGRSAARAAVMGANQVFGAVIAATFTTIAVFVPIIFTTGMTRQIFQDLGLTIAYSLLASLIVAMTVVPAAASTMLKNMKSEKAQEGRLFTRFVDGYEKALRFALRFKWAILLPAAALFALTFFLISRQGLELFPEMEMPQITVLAQMPEGSAFEATVAAAEELSDRVLAINGVETVGVTVGGGGMMAMFGMGGGGGGTNITMYILLEEGARISNDELNTLIREITDEQGLEASIGGADMDMAMLVGDAVSIRVEGRELDALRDTAVALTELVRSVPGTVNVTDMIEQAAPEIRVSVDKDAAMGRGLTVAQVFMAVNSAITAPERSLNMTISGRNYEIIVSDGDFTMPDRAGIESLQIATPNPFGYTALLDIAEVYEDMGFASINRINRNRFVTITGEIAEGFNVALVNAEIEALLEGFVPAPCCSIHIGGEIEAITDAFNDLILMIVLAMLFIYLIMVAQFQSLLSPFIIMFTIPLAFTGGFIALLIAGMPLSIVAMIGLLILAGVAVTNGIVFASRINQMRWDGMAKLDAIIDAGRKRIRPILMTAITTIFAMSVLAAGIGEGTEMMQPMAIATIGGLLYATLTTLFVVPVMYNMLHKNKDVTKEDLDEEK